MSLTVPLEVWLSTGRSGRYVAQDLRDLTFRWTDPGGYQSCRLTLDRPLTRTPDEVGYYGDCTVYDTRTGQVVWDGRQEDPGRAAGAGQIYELAALGGQSHTRDRSVSWIYVDRDMTRWSPVHTSACPGGQRSVGEDETAFPGEVSLSQLMPNGTPVSGAGTTYVSSRYMWIYRTGQKLGRFDYRWDTGRTDTNLRVRAYAHAAGTWSSTFTLARDQAANTAGGTSSAKVITTDYPNGRDSIQVRLQWTGATTTIGDDLTWLAYAGLVVIGTRYNRSGTHLLTGASYPASTVAASDVVEDLLGRLLGGQYDAANAVISATSHNIEQLAYIDPVTADDVLSDLALLESGYTWRVWERGTNGLYRFEYVPIPTAVRYEAEVSDDGYESIGSANGLYNRVSVRWRDAGGAVRTTERTATVPELDAAGVTRQQMIDLGDEVGSLNEAQRAGDQFLQDHRYAANAGTLRVSGPIMDLQLGRMVMPWEIRPGLIRLRGINPRPDALNASSVNGESVLRIVSSGFRASDATATLELDSYAPSTAGLLALLRKRAATRRR